jgi:[ribosomal protein S5]-alanine N-acetyltransferase
MALGPLTVIDPEDQRHDVERALSSDDEDYRIVCLRENEQSIGYIRANFMDEEKKIVWLRFALGSHRGCGYMKEALILFIGDSFKSGIDRIEAEVYETNERSRRLLECIGFIAEGSKRDAHHDGKRYVDVIVYGLLRKEWADERSINSGTA